MDTVRILRCAVHLSISVQMENARGQWRRYRVSKDSLLSPSVFIYPYSFYINVHIYTIFSIFVKMQIPRYETARKPIKNCRQDLYRPEG